MVTRKIRIFPTKTQKKYFNKCFGAHRYFYNKAVAKINELYDNRKQEFEKSPTCVQCKNSRRENSYMCEKHINEKIPWKINVSRISLRKDVLKNNKDLNDDEKWQADIAYDTRELAVNDAVTSYKSAVTNKLRGNIRNFKLSFMSRKKTSHIFNIDDDALKIEEGNMYIFVNKFNEIYSEKFGKKLKRKESMKYAKLRIRSKDKRRLPEQNLHDAKILYDRGSYYVLLCVEKDKIEIPRKVCHSIALDPGVRTFQTCYSPDGYIMKMGEAKTELIRKLNERIDLLKSKASQNDIRRITRWNIKRRVNKLNLKICNLVDDLHKHCGKTLASNFNHILLPEFGTSKMVQQDTLQSSTKRKMQYLSHYKFQERLKQLCHKYDSKLYIVNESFTTKTCGKCGEINESIGSNKVFKCQSCDYQFDRDTHGARNIWLKNFCC